MTKSLECMKKLKALKKEQSLKLTGGKIKILGIPDFPGKVRMVGRAVKLGTVGQLGKIGVFRRIGRSSNRTKALPLEHSSEEE